jgi:hypothetical protein
LIYSTYLGGSGDDYGYGIAVDSAGNAYVVGTTSSTNFPTTAGAFQISSTVKAAFVTKLNQKGSALVYSTYLGGSGGAGGSGIALDSTGNAYVTGTAGTNFPTTTGAFQPTSAVGGAFVTKLNSNGSGLVYSTYLSGSNGATGGGIAADGAGNVYVTGYTNSSDFPVTPGAFQTVCGGGVQRI